jgi:hypothetical protein
LYSAFRAGYKQPNVAATANMANPALVENVRRAEQAKMTNELLPRAVSLLARMLDPAQVYSERTRLVAAQTVLKYTLGDKEGAEQKEPHEMTPGELQAQIDKLRDAMAAKAKPIIDASTIAQPSVFD